MKEEANENILTHLFKNDIYPVDEIKSEIKFFRLEDGSGGITELLIFLKSGQEEKDHLWQSQVLSRMITNMKLNKKNVAVIDIEYQQVHYLSLQPQFQCKKLICFDILPGEMGLNIQIIKNKLISINGTEIIFTDSLKDIESNGQLKKRFWYDAVVHMFDLPKAAKK